jgi:hypothetical protein
MNKQIEELAKQAGLGQERWNTTEEFNSFLEKFAMLILQDCIEQCQGIGTVIEATYDGEKARRFKSVANSCAEMIKFRFFPSGVKP